MKLLVYEILDLFKKADTREAKIKVLRKYDSRALRCVLRGNFHPDIHFAVKEEVPYKRMIVPAGLGKTTIDYEVRSIYLFEEGNPRVPANFPLKRKQLLLTQILEYLEAPEAEIFMDMILKRLQVNDLTYDLVQEAFPNLVP